MNTARSMSGKIYDPVFVCMIVAVVLAVATSVALRAVVSGMGPSAARAAESNSVSEPRVQNSTPARFSVPAPTDVMAPEAAR